MRGVLQLLLWQQQQQGHLISPNNADGAYKLPWRPE